MASLNVLKNIYLSFFYGAKIGILGLNGSNFVYLKNTQDLTEFSWNGP